jgi:hypothetical protein
MESAVSMIFWMDGSRNWLSGFGLAGICRGQSRQASKPGGFTKSNRRNPKRVSKKEFETIKFETERRI